MFKAILTVFLLAHILGDFYFQSEKHAKGKNSDLSKVFIHCLAYSAAVFVLTAPIINKWIVFASLFVITTHFIIDLVKFIIKKRCKKKKPSECVLYLTDQALHIVLIIIASVYASYHCEAFAVPAWIDFVFEEIGMKKLQFALWLLMILLIWKPVNITIKKALFAYKPAESANASDAPDRNSGGLIGFLERVIILIFLSIGQYSAIGLVLTAKSIARYNKIAEDKRFAEYYLLGTLLSTLSAVIAYFVAA